MAAVVSLASSASALPSDATVEVVALTGATVGEEGVGPLLAIKSADINNAGEWVAAVTLADGSDLGTAVDSAVITSSEVIIRDGQPVPDEIGATYTFTFFPRIDNAGRVATPVRYTKSGSTETGIVFDGALIAKSGLPLALDGLPPNAVYLSFQTLALNNVGTLVAGSLYGPDPPYGDAVLSSWSVGPGDPATNSVLAAVGAPLPDGYTDADVDEINAFQLLDINDAGHSMFSVEFEGSSPNSGLVLNSTPLAIEGQPSPGGGPWLALENSLGAVNNNGDWMINAVTLSPPGAPTVTQRIIVLGGPSSMEPTLYFAAGDSAPGFDELQLTQPVGLGLADTGQLLWLAQVVGAGSAEDQILYVDDEPLLFEGDALLDMGPTSALTPDASISDNGEWALIRVILATGQQALVRVGLGPQSGEDDDCKVGDVNGDGDVDILDVQCTVLTALWQLTGPESEGPICQQDAPDASDLNCDGFIDVSDAAIHVTMALGASLPTVIDTNANQCPDACEVPE